MSTSDISVIIPYYNREKYIDEAVQSVLSQTLKPLEILIVNDCSRESSRRYLDRYADVCQIIDLKQNVGLAGARNAGIEIASGQFIAFLDDDDIWVPHKLQVQRQYMEEHPECTLVHSPAWFFSEDGSQKLFKQFGPGPMLLGHALTNEYCALVPSALVRTEAVRAIGGFDVSFREVEDREFIARCCAAGYQVEGLDEPLLRVRREAQESLTQRPWRIFKADLRMCWKHRTHYLRAYGPRGIASFVLEKGQAPARKTPYLDGVMQFLLRFVKYEMKRKYRDPVRIVRTRIERAAASVISWPTAKPKTSSTMPSDISVIIPFYNRELYIDEAIQSVLAQTLKPQEIIIVNDCSCESSRRYLDRYADFCKIVDLKKNLGLAGSRNAGVRVARGKFIALLDDDDIWMPRKLELQRKYMEEHPECAVVHTSVCAFYTGFPDKEFGRFDRGRPMTLAQALRDEYWAVPSTLMIRTSALMDLRGFDGNFRECEDREFLIRCCAAGYRVEGIDETLLRFRRTQHYCLSDQRWRMFRAHARVIWKHKKHYYRAYGIRGALNFLFITLHFGSFETRYVDGAVRLLLRLWGKNKWILKPSYREPVQWNEDLPLLMENPMVVAASQGGRSA